MTREEVKAVLDRVLTWPAERQEMAVELLLELESQPGELFYEPSDEEWEAIHEGLEQAKRGESVPDEELSALWRRFGLGK